MVNGLKRARQQQNGRDDAGRAAGGPDWRDAFELDFSGLPRGVVATSLAINVLGLALPLVALQIYDRIVPNEATGTLLLLTAGLVLVAVLDTAMKVARSYVLGWESAKGGCTASVEACSRLLAARRDEIDAARPTVWMDRLDALAEINAASGVPARIVLLDVLFVPVYLGLFALVGGVLVVVPLLVLVPMVALIVRRGERLRERLAVRAELDQRKQDFLVECLEGIQAIKAMAMEPQIQRRYERLQRRAAEINHGVILAGQSLQSLGTLTSAVVTVAVVTGGALSIVGGGSLSIGGLACCSLLAGRLMQPVMRGVGVWSEHQARAVAAERSAPLQRIAAMSRGTDTRRRCLGALELAGVSYDAPDSGRRVLDPVDLSVAAGETIALRPVDSAAKTALLGIVSAQVPPSSGRFLIDGHRIDTEWGRDLVGQIATVSNASDIFAGTILENLTMFAGSPERIERIRHYARLIGLEGSVNLLPDGYDTAIGSAVAHELPNGVIQQIAIVRALAREPAILIVDEAYTSLDSAADRLVQRALAAMRGDRTIILAAHRPSYLGLADRCYDLVEGRLRPAGPDVAPGTAADPLKVPA